MSLRSERNPRFAKLTDAEAVEQARAADRIVANQRKHMDDSNQWDDPDAMKFLTMFEANVHALDEELCARGLDWPKN